MRLIGSFVLALLVALALFGLMLALVMPPERVEQPERELLRIGVTRSVADTPSENRPQQAVPERPTPPERPQLQPPTTQAPPLPTPELKIDIPQMQVDLSLSVAPPSPALEPAAAAPAATPSAPAPAAPTHAAAPGSAEELVPLMEVRSVYPKRAAAAGIEGSVTLRFTVNAEGRVEDIEVIASEPPGVFDRAARRAISRSRFVPRQENGAPVAREATKVFNFVLEGKH
ncbi:MAG: energy transducer TonB [Pseudomonadaceae bacterium]